jgi:hypothetical protein
VVSAASTHNQLVCTLPPGQGLGESVTVTVAGTVSNALSLDYDAPVITSISPAGASTSGGTTITITGHNFGLSGSVSIGGLSAPITQGGYSHTAITCTLPAGQGTNLPVVVTSAGRSSNSGLFSYNPPAITGISAASYPTSGGTLITITGSNFGLNHSVTVGGQAAALQAGSSHTQVICTLPEGQGTNVAVVLTAGGQASPAAFINYNAPAITSISPGNGPTSGSIPITINGSNFGITPQVSIGGKPASTVFIAHNRIVFTLPAGGGADRQLIVTTEGQVSNAVLFDYDGDTFSSWSESIAWNGLDSSPGADPRNTGWENVLAYALGVNPTTTTGGETASRTPRVHGMPTFSRDSSGRLRISFWRRRGSSSPDLIYQVRFSNHPGGTEWDPPAPDPQIEVVDDIWEFCTFSDVETTSQTRFGRVKVELVTPP